MCGGGLEDCGVASGSPPPRHTPTGLVTPVPAWHCWPSWHGVGTRLGGRAGARSVVQGWRGTYLRLSLGGSCCSSSSVVTGEKGRGLPLEQLMKHEEISVTVSCPGPRGLGSPSEPPCHGCRGHSAVCWHPQTLSPPSGTTPPSLSTGVRKGSLSPERGSGEGGRQCPPGPGVRDRGLLHESPLITTQLWLIRTRCLGDRC